MYLALQRYSRPATVKECLKLLDEEPAGGRTALLAGGATLNVAGHEDIAHVIDIQALPLREVAVKAGLLRIGALTTSADLLRHEALRAPLLRGLERALAATRNRALRNLQTIGGRVSTADAAQDLPAMLVALDAEVATASRKRGRVVERAIPIADYLAPLAPEEGRRTLVTEVRIPLAPDGTSDYGRLGRTEVDLPIASAAVALRRQGRACAVRLVAGVAGTRTADAERLSRAEALLAHWAAEPPPPPDWRDLVREAVVGEMPDFSDFRATGAYRRDVTATLVLRGVESWMKGGTGVSA